MHTINAWALAIFFIVTFIVALWAKSKVNDAEDFIVAGRSLSMPLLMGTLIATWFGAGTLTVSADAVFREGLVITALEPFGVGVCLFIAGFVYAKAVWNQKVLTLADIVHARYGRTAELLQVTYGISYCGWIAVQLLAIGKIIELTFGFDSTTSVIFVTTLLTIYTLLGGMWSVAVTDVVQVVVLILGILLLSGSVFSHLGDGNLLHGLNSLFSGHDEQYLTWIPTHDMAQFNYWLGLFVVGALGNLASQDVLQRIFSAKSAEVARRSCIASGVIYIFIAILPAFLGMAGKLLLEADVQNSVLTHLAEQFLSPTMSVIFLLTLTAAITSTVDSALLGPASTFSQNLFRYWFPSISTLTLTRFAIVAVAICSASLALSGTRAIDLLQSSFTLGIPPLVVLTYALFQKSKTYPVPAIITFSAGLLIWLYDMAILLAPDNFPEGNVLSRFMPLPVTVLLLSIFLYSGSHWFLQRQESRKASVNLAVNS